MYATPVLHRQFSNREDFLETVGLYDDETGAPIKLDGTTLGPTNPNGFTGSQWTVRDGVILTTSATPITIPAYPIGNQLSALALTVGTGLAIKAGDPITISDTPTGLNSMTGYVTSYVSSTGALVCQIGVTFQFEIRKIGRPMGIGDGYGPWWDFGIPPDGPLISASLGNGILITDLGSIQILIPESSFRALGNPSSTQPGRGSGTYQTGLTMTDSINTRQVFIGRLPVLYGAVTQ